MQPTTNQSRREQAAGTKAARSLRASMRREVSRFRQKSGLLAASPDASKRVRNGQLRAIALKSTHYGFKQNYGWIGTKSNGVFQRLEATNWIADAVLNNGAVTTLATEISEIRADQVVANIAFTGQV